MTRAMLKTAAKQQLKGKWITGVLAVLCTMLIAMAASFIGQALSTVYSVYDGTAGIICAVLGLIIGIAATILSCGLALGLTKFFLNVVKGENAEVKDIFGMLKYSFKAFGLVFMISLFTLLWSCLFIIPGIIAAFRYSQAIIIMAENPEIGIMEAIRQSKEMMVGHKMELFVLSLSFIGWSILASITVIGVLWLEVYAETTYTNFYLNLRYGQNA